MKKPKVEFATTAYVECPKHVLNYMKMSMQGYADGQSNFCTTVDDLDAHLEEEPAPHGAFLRSVLKQVSGKAGDVIFYV